MLVSPISGQKRFVAAVANISDINLHSSDVVSLSLQPCGKSTLWLSLM